LSTTVKKQLKKAEQLLTQGEYQEALKLIDVGLKTKNISKEVKLGFLVLKSTIQNDLGKHKEALETAEKALKENGETDYVLLHVDALIQKGMAFYYQYENMVEFINILDKGIELLETTISVFPEKELAKRKALLFNCKGAQLLFVGNPEESQKLMEESVSFARNSGDKRVLAYCLCVAGFTKNKEHYAEEARKISTEIGNKLYLAFSYFSLAMFASKKYDYYEAIELSNKMLSLLDEVGSTFFREGSYNNLGIYYRATFQLDKALECLQRALKGSRVQSFLMLSNIGFIYLLKNELGEAQKYYLEALEKSEEVKEFRNLPDILYRLVTISVELEDFAQAQKHLDRLKQVSQEKNTETINQYCHFASILVLKASGDISDLSEAVKLLKEILTKEDLDPGWRLDALYSLLEIRIKELQMSATKEALAEVKKQAIRLEVEAEERRHQWLLGNVYRLQSQLALIDMDAETAIELLKKAETIAVESKNEFLKEKVNEDREKINQQLAMLQNLQERKAPISETVKLASLVNTIQTIKEETVLEERDKESGKIIEYRKLFVLKL